MCANPFDTVTTHRMKTYRLLNDGETILDTDLCYGFDRKWITPQDTIGMPFNSEWIFPIKREVPPPQWQTGEMPEPTGLSVLIVELTYTYKGLQPPMYASAKSLKDDKYFWEHGYGTCHPNIFAKASDFSTGRWYIQQIELPL